MFHRRQKTTIGVAPRTDKNSEFKIISLRYDGITWALHGTMSRPACCPTPSRLAAARLQMASLAAFLALGVLLGAVLDRVIGATAAIAKPA